jgi:16S rRNA (adenine1518-N6/adenine1519-N6)-dimethyltransferase
MSGMSGMDAGDPIRYSSPRAVQELLDAEGLALKKRWGQNFLLDHHARKRIVDLLELGSAERVWEIGPGIGTLTAELLRRGVTVTAFEVDQGMTRILTRLFPTEKLRIVAGDVLKTWHAVREEGERPAAVVGNLPYRVAQSVIGDLLEAELMPRQMVFTVQREVAERIVAHPGSKAYSGFSVLVQLAGSVRKHFDIAPGAFYPAPEVVSSVCEIRPTGPADATNLTGPTRAASGEAAAPALSAVASVVRAAFHSRRKTIWNNLLRAHGSVGREALRGALDRADIDPGVRAEELSPERFRRLAAALGEEPSR